METIQRCTLDWNAIEVPSNITQDKPTQFDNDNDNDVEIDSSNSRNNQNRLQIQFIRNTNNMVILIFHF